MTMVTTMKLFLVLMLHMNFIQNAEGEGPVINVHPAEIQIDHTDILDVLCTFNIDNAPNMAAIISLIISWSSDTGGPFTEMAAVTEFSPHTVNQLTSTNVSGAGFLSQDGESYLHLTWNLPSELQAGVYQCTANGVNLLGHNLVMDASAQVTVDGESSVHCMSTLDEMRKNMSSLEQIVTDMENYTKTLELRIAEMDNHTKALEENLVHEQICGSMFQFMLPVEFENVMRYKCHNYYISKSHGFLLTSATATCKKYGGYLAEMNDYDEYHTIVQFLDSTNGLDWILIGGTDEGHEGHWTLPSTNQALPFENWTPGQGNGGTAKNCLVLDEPTWLMLDVECTNTYDTDRFLCEIP